MKRIRLLRFAQLFLTAVVLGTGSPARTQSLAPEHFERQPMDRMAAWNYALVRTYERAPVSRLLTYVRENYGIQYTALARIVPQVEVDGRIYTAAEATDIRVEDFPGGVEARFRLGGVEVESRFTPLMVGTGESTRVGAAVYSIRTEPKATVRLMIGESFWQRSAFEDMNKVPFEPLDPRDNRIDKQGKTYLIATGEHSAITGVRTSAVVDVRRGEGGGEYLDCAFAGGSGEVLLAFAEDRARVVKISGLDMSRALDDVDRHYGELLANRIETPDSLIDKAFGSALTTLEYTWVDPYGWVECIHHWTSLWHMQQTAAAEWLGQTDRSRATTLKQAEMINSDGSIPHFAPFGFTRRDFGGTNQFWAWQVRRYWNFTGDLDFAAATAPVLDRVIGQTFAEYDRNDNLLLGWGLQIGNQEDYVATAGDGTTPSVEGINMMRTRSELAAGLGDTTASLLWRARADETVSRLRAKLWRSDLGRFVYFDDLQGNPRLDGQYHTLTYPAIFGITDLLDSYTSLRHLSDRLTDSSGAIYCSNNFPYHAVGTWGMQAGAAQQPWGAWGYAAAGLRNRVSDPLHALAGWVMDDNHRGSWPEVSTEAVPAYFSAPAGLYVAAVVEALFGLEMHAPEGCIRVSPNFPDDWPSASMRLKNHRVDFRRSGNRLEYDLHTTAKLARKIRWSLPVCTNVRLTDHGEPIPVRLRSGIDGVFAEAELPAENHSRIVVTFDPVPLNLSVPGSVAEGESLQVALQGAELLGIEDRGGLLASVCTDGNVLRGTLKKGLLDEYRSFGALGELNFSRRTLFVRAQTGEGVGFYIPVDLTVLPRFEAVPLGGLKFTDSLSADVLLRNNTDRAVTGRAVLRVGEAAFPFCVDLAPRSECRRNIAFGAGDATLFAPGVNCAELTLPGGESLPLRLAFGDLPEAGPLDSFLKENLHPIAIDGLLDTPDKSWQKVRKYQAFYHPPWHSCPPPMEALDTTREFRVPQIPGLSFRIPSHRFAALSRSNGTPFIRIPGDGLHCKKLYFLFVPLLDNADMFTRVARITVRDAEGGEVTRTLSFPGDLDWSCPPSAVGKFATTQQNRSLTAPPLSLLSPIQADRPEGRAPAFPQPVWWSGSAAAVTRSGVFAVVELDLERIRELAWIDLEALDDISALGLVAVTGYSADRFGALAGTPWFPPARRLPPVPLFDLTAPDSLSRWQIEGDAFSVAPVPALFNEATLNSLAKNGETAVGRALSPAFRLPEWCAKLDFDTQGGTAMKDPDGNETLCIRLLDADTGRELAVMLSAGVHSLTHRYMDVSAFSGRNLRLELVDRNTRTSYAWIGLRRVCMMP